MVVALEGEDVVPGFMEVRHVVVPVGPVEESGVDEADIDVTLSQNMLTIKGEKKVEEKEEKDGYYHLERRYGSFSPTIPLPPNTVDQDNVSANFDKGVLTITLPKLEEAQQISKRIPVKFG